MCIIGVSVTRIVLDESDKLFEMGFLAQVDEILAACSSTQLHRSLFSATLPEGVETMARTFLVDPIRIIIGYKFRSILALLLENDCLTIGWCL